MKEVNPQFANKPTVKVMGRTFAGAAALLSAGASHAAFDVSAAVTTLETDGIAAITAVGGAMISLAALAAVVRWAKAAFF
jgi:hypothetical protein